MLPTAEECRRRQQFDGFAIDRLFRLCQDVAAEEATVESIRISQQTPPAETGVEGQPGYPPEGAPPSVNG